jgi:YesN/AraC family two-component response regulator
VTAAIRVILVDDQELVRTGFRMILDGETGIEVVGEAPDGRQGVEAAGRLRPDVVVMDIRMPVGTASRPRAGSSARARTRRCGS